MCHWLGILDPTNLEPAQEAGRHRIRYWNQVCFWVKSDFASGSAAKDL